MIRLTDRISSILKLYRVDIYKKKKEKEMDKKVLNITFHGGTEYKIEPHNA